MPEPMRPCARSGGRRAAATRVGETPDPRTKNKKASEGRAGRPGGGARVVGSDLVDCGPGLDQGLGGAVVPVLRRGAQRRAA
jgi:hypothetical protein